MPTIKGVDTRHKDYEKYQPKWKRCRDVIDGQDAVHAAGTKYLPRLTDQEDSDYNAYKTRAGFYNATWRTVSGLLGMMFRKPPATDLPGVVESYSDDIDMAGTSLETLARDVALEVLSPGRIGLLVDHPQVDGVQPITVAAAQALGLRPMLKTYRAECIINWKYERVNNHWRLVRVVLEETVEEPDGEFEVEHVMQWRVLDLEGAGFYRQRVFRKAEKEKDAFEQIGDDIYPMMGSRNLTELPFFIIGTDGVDSDVDEPPLIDLVDLNLSHYRTNADYEHGCHFTGLPTLFLSGFTGDDEGNAPVFRIGSQTAIVADHPEADGKFIEFTGQGLTSLKENLDRKEAQMAVLGARMIAEEKRVAETATTAAIHRTGENSVLAAIAMAVSEALERALSVFAQWAGASGEVVYQLNRDYNPAMLDAATLTALLKAVQLGQMSEPELFDLMQRADIIDAEVTFEEHQEQVGQMAMPRPAAGANDQDGDVAA